MITSCYTVYACRISCTPHSRTPARHWLAGTHSPHISVQSHVFVWRTIYLFRCTTKPGVIAVVRRIRPKTRQPGRPRILARTCSHDQLIKTTACVRACLCKLRQFRHLMGNWARTSLAPHSLIQPELSRCALGCVRACVRMHQPR